MDPWGVGLVQLRILIRSVDSIGDICNTNWINKWESYGRDSLPSNTPIPVFRNPYFSVDFMKAERQRRW